MAVIEDQPSGIFPLDTLKGYEPSEQVGDLFVWRSRGRLRIDRQFASVTLSAQETAINSGDGSFSIAFEIGNPSKRRLETWSVMSNRRGAPLLDLYLQHTSGPSLLLPEVSAATKIARIYRDEMQLFSNYQTGFDSSTVFGVLAIINRITRATVKSSQSNHPTPVQAI